MMCGADFPSFPLQLPPCLRVLHSSFLLFDEHDVWGRLPSFPLPHPLCLCVLCSSFLRPDELAVQGSVTAFKALLDAMLSEDTIAVCRWGMTA